jgi:hypothetical protein
VGDLIFPLLAEFALLDTQETAKDPDGAGALASGFDEDFQETVTFKSATQARVTSRAERIVRIPCQIESNVMDQLQQFASGNSPSAKIFVTFSFRDLRRLGLVRASGVPVLKSSDRLAAIYEYCRGACGTLIQKIPDPPGLFVKSLTPSGFMGGRNLLIASLEENTSAVQTGG